MFKSMGKAKLTHIHHACNCFQARYFYLSVIARAARNFLDDPSPLLADRLRKHLVEVETGLKLNDFQKGAK